MPAIELKEINKDFESSVNPPTIKKLVLSMGRVKRDYIKGLRDINLTIEKGESVSIVGTNGSGKSTLLRIICGVYKPTSGSVFIDGKLYTMLDLESGFHPDLTGLENIYFNGAVLGLNKNDIDANVDDIISFSELGDYIYQPIRTYSAGMLMRLGFSIATEIDPDILLIDEVIAVGDAKFQKKCYQKLEEIKQRENTTVVFVTHDMHAATDFAKRTVWIDRGTVKMDGASRDIVQAYLDELHISMDKTANFI